MNEAPSNGPPPGAHAMNVVRWVLFAVLSILAVGSIAGYFLARRPAPANSVAAAPETALYRCPMHPSYTSDKPGDCPICGMKLVKVERGAAASAISGVVPGLADVTLSPERIQRIGVRTAVAARGESPGGIELYGVVTPDESRLQRVQLRVSGWVKSLSVSRTGEAVQAGQALLTFYSPELFQSEQEYLIGTGNAADTSMRSMHADGAGSQAPLAERLRLLGVPEDEIARLARERTAASRITLRSPVTGVVLERGVTEGQFVGPEMPLFTIADLSRPWVLADAYELDLGALHVGDAASLTVGAFPGHPFSGRVEFVYPTVSGSSRSTKVRIVADDPGRLLKPGMFGRVRVASGGTRALLVPEEAVIRAGERDYVYLAHAGGRFEPRMVVTGRQGGGRLQILSGLAAGDTVVASASFLIDSESRLEAAAGAAPPAGAHGHGPRTP